MAEKTIQDILDEMTPDELDFQALIVGAALDEVDLTNNPEIVEKYNKLPQINKYLIDFLVGNLLAEDSVLNHSDSSEVDNFLAHFGVKGMKWGVRKQRDSGGQRLSKSSANTAIGRREARDRVRGGGGSLKDAHVAALKSTGHRAINALTGDKTFWKRMAITAGIMTAGIAVTAAAPAVLPASALSTVGALVAGSKGVGGYVLYEGALTKLTHLGGAAIVGAGLSASVGGAAVGTGVHVVGNTARAVTGNAKVNKSYAALGKSVANRQTQGSRRVNSVLTKSGSLRDKDLKHGTVGAFMSQHAATPLKHIQAK